MHAAQSFTLDRVVVDGFRRGIPAAPNDDMVAAPFAEGGKARAIVDLCARLGLPAVFIDQQGQVFHATEQVQAFLGPQLDLRAGELVARSRAATDRIQDAVSQALCAIGPDSGRRHVKLGSSVSPLHLTVLDYPSLSSSQLLKAVVILERRPGEQGDGLEALATLLGRG